MIKKIENGNERIRFVYVAYSSFFFVGAELIFIFSSFEYVRKNLK